MAIADASLGKELSLILAKATRDRTESDKQIIKENFFQPWSGAPQNKVVPNCCGRTFKKSDKNLNENTKRMGPESTYGSFPKYKTMWCHHMDEEGNHSVLNGWGP